MIKNITRRLKSMSTTTTKSWVKELEKEKYPAKSHCLKVKSHYKTKCETKWENTYFFISGEKSVLYPYCDQNEPFRQNRYFYYLSGVDIPGSHLLFDLKQEKLTLFLPDIDFDDVMWSGLPMSLKDAKNTFDVDEVKYSKDIEGALNSIKSKDGESRVLVLNVSKSNESFSKYLTVGDDILFYALDESRLIKDEYEINLMKHAAQITDNSHLAVMSAVPIEQNEGHIHAEFIYHSMRQGSKKQSYDPICCSGPNCGTLHYVKNDETIGDRESILIDAGAEWKNYAADVTRCFPINGEWSKEHLDIYNLVLDMQHETMKKIKPGAQWEDLHILAHKIMIKGFLKLGIFHAGSEDEIFQSGISNSFFPHGLGHLIGLDTHDVGGYPNYSDENQYFRYLRLRRPLQEGMVVTDEPGVYFSPFLIEDGLKDSNKARFVNKEVLDKYWKIGGVRIEDDILVTGEGFENLTKITKDPEEISKIVKDAISKGKSHFHVIV